MKKTRLLEIIREEISSALREGEAEEKAAKMAALKATDLEIKALQKKKADMMKTGVAEAENISKNKQLAEKYQLDEEIINEMASIKQLKSELEKQGKEAELNAIKDAEKTTLDALKKDPTITSDGRLKGYVSAFKKELKNTHNIDLQTLLSKTAANAEGKFNDDIATNTIEKDAANQITGKEVGQRGRKASEKPAEEKPKKETKTEKPKTEPKSTETSGDEEEPSAKDVEKDETAKELGSTPEEKKVKFNQFLSSIKKNKDDKAKTDGILKLAKDKFKFPKTMMDDLKRAAGREVEA
jgi:hypothetical protein